MLKSKGVIIYKKDISSYKENPAVLNDIIEQKEFEEKRYKGKAKRYVQLMHDIPLWHHVNSLRPNRIESPQEASFWIATIDTRFLRFDSYKKESSESIPICVHPTALFQMFQFWVPRTNEIEEAILHNLRLPFVFWRPFDAEAEKVTLNILKALSRYENIGEFDKGAVTSMLVNKLLRQKISEEKEEEKHQELIKEALISDYKALESEFSKLSKNKGIITDLENIISKKDKEFKEVISQKNKEIVNLYKKLEKQSIRISRKNKREKKDEDEFYKERENLEKRIKRLEENLRIADEEKTIERKKSSFIIKNIFIPILLVILIGWVVYLISEIIPNGNKLLNTIVIGFSLVIAWTYKINKEIKKYPKLQSWIFFKKLQKIRKKMYWALSSIGIGLIVWVLIELIKSI